MSGRDGRVTPGVYLSVIKPAVVDHTWDVVELLHVEIGEDVRLCGSPEAIVETLSGALTECQARLDQDRPRGLG